MEQEEFLLSQELGFFNSINWNNLPDERRTAQRELFACLVRSLLVRIVNHDLLHDYDLQNPFKEHSREHVPFNSIFPAKLFLFWLVNDFPNGAMYPSAPQDDTTLHLYYPQ